MAALKRNEEANTFVSGFVPKLDSGCRVLGIVRSLAWPLQISLLILKFDDPMICLCDLPEKPR